MNDVKLPDGRIVCASLYGYTDRDVNAFIETDLEIEWPDGTPLTAVEYNMEISERFYLHEWVSDKLLERGLVEAPSMEEWL